MSVQQLPQSFPNAVEGNLPNWSRKVKQSFDDLLKYVKSLAVTVATKADTATTEIDFGSVPVYEMTFTVTDANITSSMYVVPSLMYVAPTGKDLDELELDGLDLMAAAGTGQFTLYARGKYGPVSGKFRIAYVHGV